MDPEPGTCRTHKNFVQKTRGRSSGQTLVTIVPSEPRTAATVSQQEGPGLTPKHWGWGSKCLGLPLQLLFLVLAEGNRDRR